MRQDDHNIQHQQKMIPPILSLDIYVNKYVFVFINCVSCDVLYLGCEHLQVSLALADLHPLVQGGARPALTSLLKSEMKQEMRKGYLF